MSDLEALLAFAAEPVGRVPLRDRPQQLEERPGADKAVPAPAAVQTSLLVEPAVALVALAAVAVVVAAAS